jgi:hypothetical protein
MLLSLTTPVTAGAHAPSHFVTFINDDVRTVIAIRATPARGSTWRALDIGGVLIGGEAGQATVRFDTAEPCKQDLAITYREGAPLTVIGFDTCRTAVLHLGRAREAAARAAVANDGL